MKGYALGFALAAGLASMFGACGGSYCDYGPRCANDPPTDSQAKANCRDQYNKCANIPSCAKCLGKLQSFNDCVYNTKVCDPTTNKTDDVKSAPLVQQKCQSLSEQYTLCINSG